MVKKEKSFTRRHFLKTSGAATGGLIGGTLLGSLLGVNIKGGDQKTDHTAHETTGGAAVNYTAALMFFTAAQYNLTQAAAERIFPADENGPGAIELDAAIYIDHQLAGAYGMNAKEYRSGPFYEPEETQGEQFNLLRKDLFLIGLQSLDEYSQKTYQKSFTDLEAADQDSVLTAFSEGKVKMGGGIKSSAFFTILRTMTMEGAYADPLYGGNKDMQGWKMRKYPGSRMNYVKEIQSESFVALEPQGLHSHMQH